MNNELNIFLLIGQSNMAGRGRLNEVSALWSPHVSMFRDGRWVPAEEPLHTDKPEIAGVGLGMSFAIELHTRARMTSIGLVPCAVGGSSLSRWMPGAELHENTVSLTKQALRCGTLKGILWHQGESDSDNSADAESYGERFCSMIQSLRLRLDAEDIPVITGELGHFLHGKDDAQYFHTVNKQLARIAQDISAYSCISSKGLTHNGDRLHFDSPSLREFGIRYASKYLELVSCNCWSVDPTGVSARDRET